MNFYDSKLKKIFRGKLLHVAILFVLFSQGIFSQVNVVFNGNQRSISAFENRGSIYVSSRQLAAALYANYYFNESALKIELKFDDYNVKVTGYNPFVIVSSRHSDAYSIIQLPVSAIGKSQDVYIPVDYSLDIISQASGKKLTFDRSAMKISVDGEAGGRVGPPVSKASTDSPFDIFVADISEKANGTMIRVRSKSPVEKYSSAISGGALHLTVLNKTVDKAALEKTLPKGLVTGVEVKKFNSSSQISFKLKDGYTSSETFTDPNQNDLFITIHNDLISTSIKENEEKAENWALDCIVIDPGHGGKDPGAIGVGGLREKDVNLAIALKLGKLIEANMKGVRVVYTRKDDSFVELYRRGQIANEQGGKLFLSLHCNSLPKKRSDVSGFEIYLLRPGRTSEAIAIAEKENSVIKFEDNPQRYEQLTDENLILVSMAHASFMRYSEQFSSILHREFEKRLKIGSRGIRQAGFYVLVGASMPSLLIESGYITNPHDAAYLKSYKGQEDIAFAIYSAIKNFKSEYDASMQREL